MQRLKWGQRVATSAFFVLSAKNSSSVVSSRNKHTDVTNKKTDGWVTTVSDSGMNEWHTQSGMRWWTMAVSSSSLTAESFQSSRLTTAKHKKWHLVGLV